MAIPTGITITVYADEDYSYSIEVGETMNLRYNENGCDEDLRIGFGSLDEMLAVADAMIRAVKMAKDAG